MSDPLADARAALNAKGVVAEAAASKLLELYRANQPAMSAFVTQQVHEANDLDLWVILIGSLCSTAVAAERAAASAHGPLATAEQQGVPVMPVENTPWVIGMRDQMEAAAKSQDRDGFASLTVDGLLRAADVDYPEGKVPLDLTLVYALQLDQKILALALSEALRRLVNERRTNG